jgi:predicted phosphodiesterase
MARLAILSDIHGNLPALEAVMADLRQAAPDQVIVNGDIVNRGPQSAACLRVIRAEGWPVVFGNHEEYALKYVDHSAPPDWYSPQWEPFWSVVHDLTADELAWMQNLPHFYRVEIGSQIAIRVTHGSPRGLNDGLGPWLSDQQLLEAVQLAPEPVIVGAHTHRTMDRRVGQRWVINCGAVGVPFNGDPRAQYLLLTAQGDQLVAEFRCVPYDRARVYAAWDQVGYITRSTIARVFKYEIETATYHYYAYLQFCKERGLDEGDFASFDCYHAATRDLVPGQPPEH